MGIATRLLLNEGQPAATSEFLVLKIKLITEKLGAPQ